MRPLSLIIGLIAPVLLHAEPNIAKWKADMLSFGATHCQAQSSYADTYYDGGRVYYQIAAYTGDTKWNTCAKTAVAMYRDGYVVANNGGVAGWWNFSDGLLKEASAKSVGALKLLSTNAAFADVTSGWGAANASDPTYSRELAYSVMMWINVSISDFVNGTTNYSIPKYNAALKAVDAHVNAWFVSKSVQPQPFMVGLTSEALIRAKGEEALPQIKLIADGLRSKWTGKDFPYLNGDGTTSSGVDLNQLIAPIYAWLCARGQYDCAFADQVFNAGVAGAYLGNPKQFNQNYRWSFDFVKWRGAQPTPTPTPATKTFKIIGGTLTLQEMP